MFAWLVQLHPCSLLLIAGPRLTIQCCMHTKSIPQCSVWNTKWKHRSMTRRLHVQETHADVERELGEARAALARAQAEHATRLEALAEREARAAREAAALDGAKAMWQAGEEERRRAIALLEDAREEGARVKARNPTQP